MKVYLGDIGCALGAAAFVAVFTLAVLTVKASADANPCKGQSIVNTPAEQLTPECREWLQAGMYDNPPTFGGCDLANTPFDELPDECKAVYFELVHPLYHPDMVPKKADCYHDDGQLYKDHWEACKATVDQLAGAMQFWEALAQSQYQQLQWCEGDSM